MEKVGWWATSILDDTNLEQGYEYDYTLYIYMGTANLRGDEGIQETSPKHGKSCETSSWIKGFGIIKIIHIIYKEWVNI